MRSAGFPSEPYRHLPPFTDSKTDSKPPTPKTPWVPYLPSPQQRDRRLACELEKGVLVARGLNRAGCGEDSDDGAAVRAWAHEPKTIRSLSPSTQDPVKEHDTDSAVKDVANTLFGKT